MNIFTENMKETDINKEAINALCVAEPKERESHTVIAVQKWMEGEIHNGL